MIGGAENKREDDAGRTALYLRQRRRRTDELTGTARRRDLSEAEKDE
jgi:hypothetical protein